MKRITSFLLAIIIVLSIQVPVSASQSTSEVDITYRAIKVIVNGTEITPCDGNGVPTEPFIMKSTGTTYLPVRAIANALGLTPAWDGKTNTVTLTSGAEPYYGTGVPAATKLSTSEAITYRDIKIVLDGTEVATSAEPFIMNSTGTTYLPLRAVASALGLVVAWDGETSTITLTSLPEGGEFSITPDVKSISTELGRNKVITFTVVGSGVTINCEYDDAFVDVFWGEWQYVEGDTWRIALTVKPLAVGNSNIAINLPEVPDIAVTIPVEISEAQHRELTAEEIYAQCSPAVFYLEVYDASGEGFASGSGFFIDSLGTAVTNYHVIEDANSAKILTSDTGMVYDVVGVYDYSIDEDWAVIKVNGTGFSYLSEGLADSVVGGATVYAIGSPLGLSNTISQGLVSNPSRRIGDIEYIQTSAAISHGSSGGALINKYGEVIGITSAGYENGQNLNLALPISIIHAYTSGSVTPLAELFPQATVSSEQRQSEAFAQLKSLILNNSNFTVSGNRAYKYSPAGGSNTYVLVYYTEGNSEYITLMCQYSSDIVCYSSMTISASGRHISPTFTAYENEYSSKHFLRGSRSLETANLSLDCTAGFVHYEGDTSVQNTALQLSNNLLVQTVAFVHHTLRAYASEYGMNDFGFTCV